MTGAAAATSSHLGLNAFFIVFFNANMTRSSRKNNDNTSQKNDDLSRS
jgi:hypothetical protein